MVIEKNPWGRCRCSCLPTRSGGSCTQAYVRCKEYTPEGGSLAAGRARLSLSLAGRFRNSSRRFMRMGFSRLLTPPVTGAPAFPVRAPAPIAGCGRPAPQESRERRALRRGRGTRGEAVAAAETRHRAGGAGSECTARGMRRRGQKNRAQTVRRAASPNPTRTPRASVWFLAAVRDCAERARSSASGCSPPTQRNLCALFRGKIFRAVDRQVQRQICPVREYARMIDTWVCALSGKAAGHS